MTQDEALAELTNRLDARLNGLHLQALGPRPSDPVLDPATELARISLNWAIEHGLTFGAPTPPGEGIGKDPAEVSAVAAVVDLIAHWYVAGTSTDGDRTDEQMETNTKLFAYMADDVEHWPVRRVVFAITVVGTQLLRMIAEAHRLDPQQAEPIEIVEELRRRVLAPE